jgi:flagella basal body P-ring formation protein FlgA
VKANSIMLSDLVPEPQKDVKLYTIRENKYTKRVKAKELLTRLQTYGYQDYDSKHHYVQFTKKSPINTQKIKTKLIQHYKNRYKSIKIKSLTLVPRTYLEKLPQVYAFGISKREHLSNKGYCYIFTPNKKKIFFNYTLYATVDVFVSKGDIDRGTELSNLNTKKKSIMLNKFRAMPLEEIRAHTLEAKHRIKSEDVLTSRDAVGLHLVRRGATVSVSLKNNGINISFLAEALTNGRDGDTITVLNRNGKKIKVRVIGHNRAEM